MQPSPFWCFAGTQFLMLHRTEDRAACLRALCFIQKTEDELQNGGAKDNADQNAGIVDNGNEVLFLDVGEQFFNVGIRADPIGEPAFWRRARRRSPSLSVPMYLPVFSLIMGMEENW